VEALRGYRDTEHPWVRRLAVSIAEDPLPGLLERVHYSEHCRISLQVETQAMRIKTKVYSLCEEYYELTQPQGRRRMLPECPTSKLRDRIQALPLPDIGVGLLLVFRDREAVGTSQEVGTGRVVAVSHLLQVMEITGSPVVVPPAESWKPPTF